MFQPVNPFDLRPVLLVAAVVHVLHEGRLEEEVAGVTGQQVLQVGLDQVLLVPVVTVPYAGMLQ